MNERTRHEKWREAGWKSPDDILTRLTDLQLRVTAAQAVLAKIEAMDPNDFRTGQDHLTPAFREINFERAFKALGEHVNEIEATLASPAAAADDAGRAGE